ncbi:MAG: GH116 family glycosyl hydrolase [Bacillota bacterium]
MATYAHNSELRSGMPLGGIGTGTLEIFPDGTRGAFTGLNNWEHPLGQLHNFRSGLFGDYRVANPFAVWVDDGSEQPHAFLLQTLAIGTAPAAKGIKMNGMFPIAELIFDCGNIPLAIKMIAFSPFIPGRYEDSGIPAAFYKLIIASKSDRPLKVSVMASAINCIGSWNVARYNEARCEGNITGIIFRKDRPNPFDQREGTIALAARHTADTETYICDSSQYVKKCFRDLAADDLIVAGWDQFAESGSLPNGLGPQRLEGEFGEWMGAIAQRLRHPLLPGASAQWDFVYAWHMPNHPNGHHYENRYQDAWTVAADALNRFEELYQDSASWQNSITHHANSSSLPDWLMDALINNLYPIVTASWWVRDGRFALLECPTHHPLLGTLDVHYYGSIPLALLFPDLEKRTMRQFAHYQLADGYIPHDLGKNRLDCPSTGTSAGPRWKDLCSKFALLVYRNVLYWHDDQFLKEMYPTLIKAMEWQAEADRDGDGLPENEGMDSTFDNWAMSGVTPYTGSLYLAALRAAEECALRMGDQARATLFRDRFSRASDAFDTLLWNGSYYRAIAMPGPRQSEQLSKARSEAIDACSETKDVPSEANDDCTVCQLNGQWYAHMLGLGYLLPPEKVRKAVRAMLDLNAAASPYGAVNSVSANGQHAPEDDVNHQAGNILPGETYALAALAIFEGFIDQGMELARKTYDNIAGQSGYIWNQPDVINADDGKVVFGDDYERNMSIWSLLPALAEHDQQAASLWKQLLEQAKSIASGRDKNGLRKI